jgi:hypothetical protein
MRHQIAMMILAAVLMASAAGAETVRVGKDVIPFPVGTQTQVVLAPADTRTLDRRFRLRYRVIGLAPYPFAIQHQRDVVQGEQKPPVDGLPWPEVNGRHTPSASFADQIANGVQYFPESNARPSAAGTDGRL